MRSQFVVFFVTALLMGCSALSGAPPTAQVALTAQGTGVAWGERVAFAHNITRLRLFDAKGRVVTDQTFSPARAFVDLPPSPTFPDLNVASDPVDEAKFFSPLTASEQALYVNRGRVELFLANNTPNRPVTLNPYGAVLSGQVHALASVREGCEGFFEYLRTNVTVPFRIVTTFGVSLIEGSSLCQVTFDIGAQDTAGALARLEGVLGRFTAFTSFVGESGFVLDKDKVSSLDPPGSGVKSMDPTCDQIRKWLDPIGNNGYGLVDMTKLKVDIGANNAVVTGSSVHVVIIGGGIGQNDDVRCGNSFRFHDTHIRKIIQEIAPNVTFHAFKVCNAEGTCASAEIVRALMRTLGIAKQNPKTLVNMSLGGPLPDRPTFGLLRLLGQLFGVPAIVSAGNGPNAPAHYPASFSLGVASSPNPSLLNVIPVAAAGFKLNADDNGHAGYVIAGFNTRANAIIFAPGVNVCPQTATSFRCAVTQPYPDDLGLTGTSFAAPVVTGLAALYTEAKGTLPTRLGRCLLNNTRPDPVTQLGYAAFGSAACP